MEHDVALFILPVTVMQGCNRCCVDDSFNVNVSTPLEELLLHTLC